MRCLRNGSLAHVTTELYCEEFRLLGRGTVRVVLELISEEPVVSICRVERISYLGTALAACQASFLVIANVVPSSIILSRLKTETFFIVTAVKTSNLTWH
jgi:hypothetical protein